MTIWPAELCDAHCAKFGFHDLCALGGYMAHGGRAKVSHQPERRDAVAILRAARDSAAL